MLHRPKKLLVAAVLGLGLILVLLPAGLNDRIKGIVGWFHLPFKGVADGLEETGRRAGTWVTPRTDLQDEIDRLRRDNRRLRLRALETAETFKENERLRESVGWKVRQPWNLLMAKVIVREPANFWQSFHLDAGSEQGVSIDDPVLTDQGLAGKVVFVWAHRSRVALLGDSRCKVAAMLAVSGHTGSVVPSSSGTGRGRIVEMKYLPNEAPLEQGLEVVTRGTGGIFPRGIRIGRIIDGRPENYGLSSAARVRLWVDLERLTDVWIILRDPETEEGAQG